MTTWTPFEQARMDIASAALALTTLIPDGHVPREVWDEASGQFEPDELAQLVWAIVTINAWNRIAISTRMLPGSYEPR